MRIIIAGAGAVGSHLAKMLSKEQHDIILIDTDKEKLEFISDNLDLARHHSQPPPLQTSHRGQSALMGTSRHPSLNLGSHLVRSLAGN